jgi:hypothetical protein
MSIAVTIGPKSHPFRRRDFIFYFCPRCLLPARHYSCQIKVLPFAICSPREPNKYDYLQFCACELL